MFERKGIHNSTVTIKVELVEKKILLTTIVPPRGRTNADLADRVKSVLGPIVHAMDLPRIHVMA
jgi:hypothetical protein